MYYWHNSGIIYISQTMGDDANSGFLPDSDEYRNGPVQSVDRALGMIREMRHAGNLRPVTVSFTEDHYLDKPIEFTRELHSVTLLSHGGRKRIIGGFQLKGWKQDVWNGLPCFSAVLPRKTDGSQWDFSDLIVNGSYAELCRYPKEGTLRAVRMEKDAAEGETQPLFNPTKWFEARREDLDAVPDILDSTVNFYHYWVDAHSPVESYDSNTRIVTMRYPSQFAVNTQYGSGDSGAPMHHAAFRYYLTNVPSQFGVPGEWFLHHQTGTVYYMPREEETNPELLEVYVPTLSTLVEVRGSDVRLQNLELMCTRGDYESKQAAGPVDAQYSTFASDIQSVCWAPGAIRFVSAQRSEISGCYIHSLGVHAVEIMPGCRNVRVENNRIEDICAGGISIWGGAADEPEETVTSGCVIRRNRISGCGVRYAAGNGILVRNASIIEISENEICNLEYSGITAGWVWGYADSSTFGIIIRRNHIHHIGTGKLSDMGGIYLLGKQQGTVVAENRIHDIRAVSYGGWGIYADEGSSYITVENNVVYDTKSECFNQHYGCSNLVRNNIFAFGGLACIRASLEEHHEGFLLENNIIVTDGIPFYPVSAKHQPMASSRNLYWDLSGKYMFQGRYKEKDLHSSRIPQSAEESYGFYEWTQVLHKDTGSIMGDPLFVDLDSRDFRLKEDSPAISLGFQPINGFPATGSCL